MDYWLFRLNGAPCFTPRCRGWTPIDRRRRGSIRTGGRQIVSAAGRVPNARPGRLISHKRGRPQPEHWVRVFRETVLAIVRERYADFGPTLAAEKLSEIQVSISASERLRHWMMQRDPGSAERGLKRIHNHVLGTIIQANWYRSTARSTPRSRTSDPLVAYG